MIEKNNGFLNPRIKKLLIWCLTFVMVCSVVVVSFLAGTPKYVLASLINGVSINALTNANRYAYGENVGWIDFNPTGGSVQVGDNGLTGYTYGENVGWIKLGYDAPPYLNTNSTNWGVNNDGSGNLSGYAYGENVGWIDFNPTGGGVAINTTTGTFSGYAYGENVGWISLNGTGYGVTTDWRPSVVVNGACGLANGESFNSVPSTNLCAAGTASSVIGTSSLSWSCAGSNGGTTASCSATLISAGGGGANYYIISAQAGADGSISPTGSTFLISGGSQTYTIIPAAGYQVADVLVDGVSQGAITTYTFSNVTIWHTISATFTVIVNSAPAEAQTLTQAEAINYASGVLNAINTFLIQNSKSIINSSNKNQIIQVIQKLLQVLANLLGTVTN